MVTHPSLQNANLRLPYLLNRLVEDRLNASAAAQAMPWQKTAAALLQHNLDQESSLLATPLAELFATEQPSSP